MKLKNLNRTLRFFDGESGLDNDQIKYFLVKAFKSGKLVKKDILMDLCNALNDKNFDWIEFVKEMNLINNIENSTNEEVMNYIIELICEQVFPIRV